MRDDEFPIFLKANDERLIQRYKKCIITNFDQVTDLNKLS
jgi:capsule polysaccharide export protein KpsE/RkpR